MKEKVFLYSEIKNKEFFKDFFLDFEVVNLNNELLIDKNFKNKNVIFITKKNIEKLAKTIFFLNNNVVAFSSNDDEKNYNEKFQQTKVFNSPLKVQKFNDIVKTCFFSKVLNYEDVKIIGEQMTNVEKKITTKLTPLEKKILTEFIEKKEISREYFLENIIKITKSAETKTIESHLTRIRKKILIVESKILIFSKEDVFYLGC